jgi:hypothetical protein
MFEKLLVAVCVPAKCGIFLVPLLFARRIVRTISNTSVRMRHPAEFVLRAKFRGRRISRRFVSG